MVRYAALKGLYELEKTIGCGGFAKVKAGIHIATGEKVAIKIMEKTALGDDLPRVKLEIEAMKTLLHEHVCKLYQVIETESHYFMVLEYCAGGELFDHIVQKNRLSEAESRKFFRQIVSAVAYLHSLGFAHRDLKPENVLLDRDQNLKLIDFGLCAKPKGGMQNPLYTSCGSPTYAAPELIQGKKYLGSEIDIWSMGVLLYALLCGFLPFDDHSIENLYKKILSGNYDEPSWLSSSSRRLIRAMLQTDPSKRITIKELCHHPWITTGFLNPVSFVRRTKFERDEEVLCTMSALCGESSENMWNRVMESNRTEYVTATYLLLFERKIRGQSLKISAFHRSHFKQDFAGRDTLEKENKQNGLIMKLERSPRRKVRNNTTVETAYNVDAKIRDNGRTIDNDFTEPKLPGRKRMNSADIDDLCSPKLPKKANARNKQITTTPTPSSTPTSSSKPSEAKTPQSTTPGSARKVILGLEKGFNRVRCVLTPKRSTRKNEAVTRLQPNILTGKGLCNVSSTSSNCPKYVLSKLRRALQHKGIVCCQKGYILQGETEHFETENRTVLSRPFSSRNSCSFELEVCLVKGVANEKPLVGIRRKRLKGDAWVYKRVCEEVLALAAEDVSTEQENMPETKGLI